MEAACHHSSVSQEAGSVRELAHVGILIRVLAAPAVLQRHVFTQAAVPASHQPKPAGSHVVLSASRILGATCALWGMGGMLGTPAESREMPLLGCVCRCRPPPPPHPKRSANAPTPCLISVPSSVHRQASVEHLVRSPTTCSALFKTSEGNSTAFLGLVAP
jgi:hypothetical protein